MGRKEEMETVRAVIKSNVERKEEEED